MSLYRLIPVWKRLYKHLNRLLDRSTHSKGVPSFSRENNQLIQLLCCVQTKLHHLGYSVPLHLHDKWTSQTSRAYMKGCECYIKGLPEKAVQFWLLAISNCHQQKADTPVQDQQQGVAAPHPSSTTGAPASAGSVEEGGAESWSQRQRGWSPLEDGVVEASLLGILYTHLGTGNLAGALELVDSLITCHQVGSVSGGGERKGRRLPDLPRKDKQKLPPAPATTTPLYVPYLSHSCQQGAVQSLARFMALYFTNRPLYVFPPCSALPLPPLHLPQTLETQERRLDIGQEEVNRAVRQQELSEKWTVETALNLFLVSGLVPEAVWLAHQLGDWKSAFTLAVVYSSQVKGQLMEEAERSLDECLTLPPSLSPTTLLREGLNSILQTPILDPHNGAQDGKKVQRAGSFSGVKRSGSSGGLLEAPATPLRKSSSVCSLVEDDKMAQVMVSQTLTDILMAATLSGQDPTPWLVESMVEECLVLAQGFSTLVPEEFYLPAPPYYCPQPDYIPNDSDPLEVLEEDDKRREVNDLVQLILLVLNASRCSLPCARWYVEELRGVQEKQAKFKVSGEKLELPDQLQVLGSYPINILGHAEDHNNNVSGRGRGVVMKCFRDLCCILWMLYTRDKLSLAIRKYQTSKERSLQVKPASSAEEKEKVEKLLKAVLSWAECLHPFSRFLHLEDEVNDILLTVISELPLSKETVSILGRHFHQLDGLPPFLEEKLSRLREKLRRKKVAVDHEKARRREKGGANDGERRSVAFETLMTHYKRQSKRRRAELETRKSVFGSLDDSVFEASDVEGANERGGTPKLGIDTANTAESNTEPSRNPGEVADSSPSQFPLVVGSREFEGNAAFLHFLETFFLVTFGSQVQDEMYMSQRELPLIGAFQSRILETEFRKSTARHQNKSHLEEVQVSHLSLCHSPCETSDVDLNKKSLTTGVRGPGLFKKLFGCPLEKDNNVAVPRLSLQRSGSFSSLQDSDAVDSPDLFVRRRSSKKSVKMGVQLKKCKTSFVSLTPSDCFRQVRMNLGEEYVEPAELLEWLTRWAGRKPSKAFQRLEGTGDESRALMQVKLPQQLVLLSVWLLKQVYIPHAFKTDRVTSSRVRRTRSREPSPHGKVQFKFRSKHSSNKEPSRPGRHRHSDKMRRISKDRSRERIEKMDNNRNLTPGDDEPIQIRASSPYDPSTADTVGVIPQITVDDDTSNGVSSLSTRIEDQPGYHPLRDIQQDEMDFPLTTVETRPAAEVAQNKLGKDGLKKKRRQLPEVTEDKRRNSPTFEQLLKGKIPMSNFSLRRGITRTRTVPTENDRKNESRARKYSKKRSKSESKKQAEVKEYEMKDLQGRLGTRIDIHDLPPASPRQRRRHHKIDENMPSMGEPRFHDPYPVIQSAANLTPYDEGSHGNKTREDERRRSVDIISQSSKGGGILGSNIHVYESSSSSPNVSSLEDSDDDVLNDRHSREKGRTGASTGQPGSSLKSSMEDADENGKLAADASTLQEEANEASAAAKNGGGKKKGGDIQRLVRSEVRRIMEAQHQSMMSMLETGGTLLLKDLQSLPGHSLQDAEVREAEMQQGGRDPHDASSANHQAGQRPDADMNGSLETDAARKNLDGGEVFVGNAKNMDPRNQRLNIEITPEESSQSHHTTGVPALRLEDLESAREGDHQSDKENIPGLIQGLPLLTVPKEPSRYGGQVQGYGGDSSEYDMIPTRERDGARIDIPGKQDIVLLRATPRGEEDIISSRNVAPPRYKQTFTFDSQSTHGPPLYADSELPVQRIGGMPLLRIPPQTNYRQPLPQQPHFNPITSRSQVDHPSDSHGMGPKPTVPHSVGMVAPVRHTPREAWVNATSQGRTQQNHYRDTIDIPLLRIDPEKRLPGHQPVLMQPLHLVSKPPAGNHPDHAPINLPLLQAKDPNPPVLFHPVVHQKPALPLISREELLAYQEEKRRQELEAEQELRRQTGEPMQLLRATPRAPELASTSRQRRREQAANRAKTLSETQGLPRKKRVKYFNRQADSKQGNRDEETNDSAENGDIGVQDLESPREEGEQEREGEGCDTPQRNQILVVKPRTEKSSTSTTRAEGGTAHKSKLVSQPSPPSRVSPVERHDVETQVDDLGRGYAIKPGTYDEALHDPDARPLLPTSAQIHYETVMKLQQPPEVVKPREAETQTKETLDVGTETEGTETLDEMRERLEGMHRADTKTEKPTKEEAEEQYTSAATGLNKAGNIIAPDIFFGLRFGSGRGTDGSQFTGSQGGQPGSSSRNFINVVDINAEDVFRDIPMHPDSKRKEGRHGDGEDPKDGSSGRKPGESDAKRRRKSDDREGDVAENDPSVAELHYKALFHRDAVPEDGLALLEDEEDASGVERRRKIGDELTRKLLEAKLDKAERGLRMPSQLSLSRGKSRDRIQRQLADIDQRLGAVGEVSQSMQRDYSNTRLLLHTMENLSDAMAASGPQETRERPDYSFKDFQDPARRTHKRESDAPPPGASAAASAPAPASLSSAAAPAARDDTKEERRETKEGGDGKDDAGGGEGEDEERIDGGVEKDGEGELERTEVTEGNLTLGISGISGVSDIIAEVIAGDEMDAEEFGITEEQQKAAQRRVKIRQAKYGDDDLGDLDLTTLTDRQLQEIFSPRDQQQREEPPEPWPFAAKPKQRPKEEQQRIREWMERRKKEQVVEYKKKRGEKIEAEHRPFKSASGALRQIPTSTKEIKKAENEKKMKRELKQKDHFEDRLTQAKALMAEIFEEKPNIPQRPPPSRPSKTTKQATTLATARQTPQPASSRQPPAEQGPGSSGLARTRVLAGDAGQSRDDRLGPSEKTRRNDARPVAKGTYMFIDSGAFRGRQPLAPRQQNSEHQDIRDESGERRIEDRRSRAGADEKPQPARRTLLGSLERSVQFVERRSSDEDLQLVLDEMSDLVAPPPDEEEEENNRDVDDGNVTLLQYMDRSYKDIVRVQRPEVTRKKYATPRRSKTYTDMLQEMKAEVGSSRAPSTSDLKAKQRLYGSKRLPGWNKNRKQYPRTPKTYTQQLAEMKGARGGEGQKTRLIQRSRPRPSTERPATATMTLGQTRRQQVERRGITPEPTPRSSTPYTSRLAELGNTGTHREREAIVSPRQNPGMRTRPRAHNPIPYVDRLKQNAAEAAGAVPTRKYRTVYGKGEAVPTATYTYKAAPLHTPSPRHQPYGAGSRRPPGGGAEEGSDVSDLSPWSVSDDVKRILDNDSDLDEGLPTIVEPQYEFSDVDDHDLGEYADYAASVDIRELEEIVSLESGSIVINWDEVDELIETVQ
ncbi:uncharacterized protein [Diadema antillarum]|uniref:uncharacterized protein n=1 Tax=Diadema antillarum TaxID=105358 RepID=UPI003A87F29E